MTEIVQTFWKKYCKFLEFFCSSVFVIRQRVLRRLVESSSHFFVYYGRSIVIVGYILTRVFLKKTEYIPSLTGNGKKSC